MKPFAPASKDNYFGPVSSGSDDYQPQYLVAPDLSASVRAGYFYRRRMQARTLAPTQYPN